MLNFYSFTHIACFENSFLASMSICSNVQKNDINNLWEVPRTPAYILGEFFGPVVERIFNLIGSLYSTPPSWGEIDELQFCQENILKAEEKILTISKKPPSILPFHLDPIQCDPLPKQGDLVSNFKLAKKILLHTRNTVRFSSNNLIQSREFIEKQTNKKVYDFSDIFERTNDCLLQQRNHDINFKKLEDSEFRRIKMRIEIAKHTAIGNCQDMSEVALFTAMEMGIWNARIEMAFIDRGDHQIIIIGREFESNPKDYKTWGANALVIDSWAGKIFKVSEIENNLIDYISFDSNTVSNTGRPITELFNPVHQKLEILLGNICSIKDLEEDFKKYSNYIIEMENPFKPYEIIEMKIPFKSREILDKQKQLYDTIIQRLEEFQQTTQMNIKLSKAKILFELCSDPSVSKFEKIKLLRDQLFHFIELSPKWCTFATIS